MTSTLHLVGEGFVQSLFRMGELFAQSEVDKRMFRLAAQDESRHVAFGVMHMKHVLETEPERRDEVHTYLDRMEGMLGGGGSAQAGLTGGGETAEALAILLGGGSSQTQLRRATASCWRSASGRSTSTCTGSRSSGSATGASG